MDNYSTHHRIDGTITTSQVITDFFRRTRRRTNNGGNDYILSDYDMNGRGGRKRRGPEGRKYNRCNDEEDDDFNVERLPLMERGGGGMKKIEPF